MMSRSNKQNRGVSGATQHVSLQLDVLDFADSSISKDSFVPERSISKQTPSSPASVDQMVSPILWNCLTTTLATQTEPRVTGAAHVKEKAMGLFAT